ncbi:alpha/beta fold hydrolase [Pseudooceanicola sp.]|uniref:alpha/beta fold hydrolase n=1 Tax=Pseudooceanicola sp. TaxID=1914328 RepID=UPI004059ADF8
MRFLILTLLVALMGCSNLPPPQRTDANPVVHDGNAEKGIEKAIVVIPGALASVQLFAPVLEWDIPDSTVIAYRFPGVDGLELNHRVDIIDSAALIARHLNALEAEEVYLIGYSTGGPIALETARRLRTENVQIAMISSASDSPAAALASLKGALDVIKAMFRAKRPGLEETWAENYRTLLYGRDHFTKEEQAEQSRRLAAMQRGQLTTPPNKMTMAHTADLMTWYLEDPEDLADVRIGFFHGAEDSVFSNDMTRRYARRLHADGFKSYEGQGHLLFVTEPELFDDVRAFFGLS